MSRMTQGIYHYFNWPEEVKDQKFKELKEFTQKWSQCRECCLNEHAFKVVLWRGILPCEVLFVGEAPGFSEDICGRPFCGPSGSLLDQIIDRSIIGQQQIPFAITNTVCCIPLDDARKIRKPKVAEIKACSPRFQEFIKIAQPELIITLGKVSKSAENMLMGGYPVKNLVHPANIVRIQDEDQLALEVSRCIQRIDDWVPDYVCEGYLQ